MSSAPPRFIADCMLGKLARWLRILGFDAAYERAIADAELVERAIAEERILLTKDTRLVKRRRMPRFLLVESQDPSEQLRQTVETFDLRVDTAGFLRRCILCNEPTREIPREEARPGVPPYVYETQEKFARCPICRRIYWRATHVADIVARLGAIDPPG